MKKYYKVEYNHTTKTWCLNKYIESDQAINFYTIYETPEKKLCMEKYKEMKVNKCSEKLMYI